MAVGKLWLEVWDRPGATGYGPKNLDLAVSRAGFTKRHTGVGLGSAALPRDGPLDDILFVDPDTPANSVWSTLKVFAESDPSTPIFEWLASPRVGAQDKNDPDTEITGFGIEAIAGFGRVEPFDWDGSDDFESEAPDWIWGGRDIIRNGGLEDSQARPEVNEIIVTATGGTFTLDDGTDTTAAIAWNAAALTIETRIETDIAAIDDVLVTGDGSEADPYRIEWVTPAIFAGGLTLDPALLTGGSATLTRTVFGALQPTGWTKSQLVSFGTPKIFGAYDSFRVTAAQAHSGTLSLLIDPAAVPPRYAGAQQVVRVTPGKTYQASIWIRPVSATDEYRFVIRGIDEDFIASETGALSGTTYPADVWSEVTISDLVIPSGSEEIIIRFANVDPSGNPAIFYLDDLSLQEGEAPTTVGEMWIDLYAAWTDISLRNPLVWDNGAGVAYLSNDFGAVLDSAGNAWTDSEVSLTFKPRMSGLQVLKKFAELGYQWRVVPDSVSAGTYLLQLYNPGGLGTTPANVGIQAGSADIRKDHRYRQPASDYLVQGMGNLSARDRDSDLLTAFGRIESSLFDPDITSLVDGSVAAAESKSAALVGAESLVYTMKAQEDLPEPLIDYDVGDTISVEDPPLSGTRQLAEMEVAWDKSGAEYGHKLSSASLTGQAAVNQQVAILLQEFKRDQEQFDDTGTISFGDAGGGAPSIVVAASNAGDLSKSRADFICTGFNDEVQIQAAIDRLGVIGGRVLLTEGTFGIVVPVGSESTAAITLTAGVDLLGMGAAWNQASTFLAQSNTGSGFGTMIRVRGGTLKDLSLSVNNDANGILMDDSQSVVAHVYMTNDSGHGVIIDEGAIDHMVVRDCHFLMLTGDAIHASDTGGSTPQGIYILDNYFEWGGTRSIYLGTVNGAVIAGNVSEGSEESSIYVDDSAVLVSVVDNILKLPGFHGILLTGVSDSLVTGNVIYRPSRITDNTYDGIILVGNSDRNDIWDNKIIGDPGATQPRYGVNISAATCDDNSYLGNRTGPASDYGTGAYNDAGTGTVNTWPGAAAPQGDNLL